MATRNKLFERSIDEFTSHKVNKVRWLPAASKGNVDLFQLATGGWDEDGSSPLSLWSFTLPLHNEESDYGDDEYGMNMGDDDEYNLLLSQSVDISGSVMDMGVVRGQIYVSTSDGDVRSFEYGENNRLRSLQSAHTHKGSANALSICVDNQDNVVRIATGGEDGRICILSKDLRLVEKLDLKTESSVNGLTFYDANTVISVHTSGLLNVWDIRMDRRYSFTDTANRPNTLHSVGVCAGLNKDVLVAGSSNGSILVWDIRKITADFKHTVCQFQQHTSNVWEVKVLEPRTLMTCSSDKRVLQWDLKRTMDNTQNEFSQVAEVTRCQQMVNSFDYNESINAVVVAAENDLLRIVYE